MYETPTKITITDQNIISKLASIVTTEVRDGSYYDPTVLTPRPPEERVFTTSAENLEKIRSSPNQEQYSNCCLENDRLAIRIRPLDCPALPELQEWVEKHFPDYTFSKSNGIVYPPGGYLGWHTNADKPGLRFYLHWIENVGQASFKYWDGSQVIDDVENEQCFIRIFNVKDMTDPLWHCVYTDTWRVSVGFYMEAK
jgi:hypothetical protein